MSIAQRSEWGVFCTSRSRYIWLTKNIVDGEGQRRKAQDAAGNTLGEFSLLRILGPNYTGWENCGFGNISSSGDVVTIGNAADINSGVELLPLGTNADIVITTIQRVDGVGSTATGGTGDEHCPSDQAWDSIINRCVDIATGEAMGGDMIRSNYIPMILVLSTLRGNTRTTLTGDGKCDIDVAVGVSGTFNYCALNKFEFSARVGARQ